ncbi:MULTISPECIES: hypothetical protein [unclassified Luteococcus]|uniref:hypothetical protein n=1 Tax=unclassified Luteococcus TaxID=2639923 RepID=UPI00313F3A90
MKIRLGGELVEVTVSDVDLDQEVIYFEGERLTEARAEELGREISRRYGLLGGRPPKDPQERASVQRAVRFTPGDAARLRARATELGVSESELIRRAVLKELGAA